MDKPKKDTALKVLHSALGRSSTSRTAIADETGLSYVTVDKTVNFLLRENILKQSYSSKSAVIERRSRMISPMLHYWIAAYELMPQGFTFRITDLSLRVFKEFTFTPEDTPFIDDLLRDFLSAAVTFAEKHVRSDCCIGSFVTVCGEYDGERDKVFSSPFYHLPAIRIKKFFSEYTFNTVPRVYSLFSSFAAAFRDTLSVNDGALCLFLTCESVFTSYIMPKTPVTVKDIGAMRASCNLSLSRLTKKVPDPDLLLGDLCSMLYVLTNTLNITKIAVYDGLYNNGDAVCGVIKNILTEKHPDFSLPEIAPARLSEISIGFISREIRKDWFLKKILEERA